MFFSSIILVFKIQLLMKKFFAIVACLITVNVFAQSNYWQQQVNYKITVSLNDKNHSLKG